MEPAMEMWMISHWQVLVHRDISLEKKLVIWMGNFVGEMENIK